MSEWVFAGLFGFILIVGLGLLTAALVADLLPVAVAAIVFLAIGGYSGKRILWDTACELRVDSDRGVLHWRSTLTQGDLPLRAIQQVVRDSRRPSVYAFRSDKGETLPFWLMKTDQAVQSLFETLTAACPQIEADSLYRRSRRQWRTLPSK